MNILPAMMLKRLYLNTLEILYNRKHRYSYANQMAPMQFDEMMNVT